VSNEELGKWNQRVYESLIRRIKILNAQSDARCRTGDGVEGRVQTSVAVVGLDLNKLRVYMQTKERT
jgi:hypothetical protein